MKIIRPFLATVILLMVFSSISFAFEPLTDCSIKIAKAKFKEWGLDFQKDGMQKIFDDYTNSKYSNHVGSEYILCFDFESSDYQPTKTLIVDTNKVQKSVVIYNLIADAAKLTDSTFIILTGSSIALLNSTLTGPGSGTAIQIASGSATIESLTCSNFAQCINIAKDASALVTQGKFTNVGMPIKYEEIPAFAGMTEEWTGKHVSETEATKVDRIAGKLELTECKGSVEMYLKA